MSPAIIGIRHARDEAGSFQPIDEADECARPDIESLREASLVEPREPREMDEDEASRARHAREPCVQLSIEEAAPQPASLLQQPHDRVGIIRIGIPGRRRWPCDRNPV